MISTICYIDPASTALLWQLLAGIFISLGVILGIWWKKISTFFKSLWVKIFRKDKKAETQNTKVDESLLEIEDDDEVKEQEVILQTENETKKKTTGKKTSKKAKAKVESADSEVDEVEVKVEETKTDTKENNEDKK